jgi:2-polyprenyl-6-methoxyphenol hydroxylase-like FAD-dependent oxidoreductase
MNRNAKILIVGGGIGGLTLAYWLKQHGFDPLVIERRAEYKRIGHALSISGHGVSILKEMGLEPKLTPHLYNTTYSISKTASGRTLRKFNITSFTNIAQNNFGINRADLHKILLDQVTDLVEVRQGVSLASLTPNADNVTAVFDNGDKTDFDVVIGVDGANSFIRNTYFGNNYVNNLGIAYMAYTVPNQMGLNTDNVDVLGKSSMVSYGGYNVQEVAAIFWLKTAPGATLTGAQKKSLLQETFSYYAPPVDQIIALANPDTIFYGDLMTVQLPTWSKGRIVLLGDAAYCLSPLSGKGASMAIFGAHLLANELANNEYETAFANYENRMKTGIERFQKETTKFSKSLLPGTRLSIATRNAAIAWLPEKILFGDFTSENTESI